MNSLTLTVNDAYKNYYALFPLCATSCRCSPGNRKCPLPSFGGPKFWTWNRKKWSFSHVHPWQNVTCGGGGGVGVFQGGAALVISGFWDSYIDHRISPSSGSHTMKVRPISDLCMQFCNLQSCNSYCNITSTRVHKRISYNTAQLGQVNNV